MQTREWSQERAGFTLIELMVVVIVVGVLVSAAVPIYRFFVRRAYASEAKATIGTMIKSMAVFAHENGNSYPDFVFGVSTDNEDTDILKTLGVSTDTNSWWHAGFADKNSTTSSFGSVPTLAEGGSKPVALDQITLDGNAVGPLMWAHGDVANQLISGIQILYDLGMDRWYQAI